MLATSAGEALRRGLLETVAVAVVTTEIGATAKGGRRAQQDSEEVVMRPGVAFFSSTPRECSRSGSGKGVVPARAG